MTCPDMRQSHIVFLAGAPDQHKLDWQNPRLLTEFEGRSREYLNLDDLRVSEAAFPASNPIPKWRTITVGGGNLTLITDRRELSSKDAIEFLSFDDDMERSDFLDHTLASVQRSGEDERGQDRQVDDYGHDDQTSFPHASSTDISFETASSSVAEFVSVPVTIFPDVIQDLQKIPSARHLLAIQPQTVTAHLLVGVITVETRIVQLRKRPVQMELVELLVGDDTAAPFKITFWLQPINDVGSGAGHKIIPDARSAQRAILAAIRSGNIILITNVALSVFKNVAYGQSLTRRPSGCTTDVMNISRSGMTSASASVQAKFERVRRWVTHFVNVPSTMTDPVDKRNVLPEWSPVETSRVKRRRNASDDVGKDA
jgi:hypothetical protein